VDLDSTPHYTNKKKRGPPLGGSRHLKFQIFNLSTKKWNPQRIFLLLLFIAREAFALED
jgi:hypothetical protein